MDDTHKEDGVCHCSQCHSSSLLSSTSSSCHTISLSLFRFLWTIFSILLIILFYFTGNMNKSFWKLKIVITSIYWVVWLGLMTLIIIAIIIDLLISMKKIRLGLVLTKGRVNTTSERARILCLKWMSLFLSFLNYIKNVSSFHLSSNLLLTMKSKKQ